MIKAMGIALAASILLLASDKVVQADDVIRLGGVIDAKTQNLGFDGDVNTELVGRYGYYRGGYRGGYYGGYRGGYNGAYRYGYARGYYRPYYHGYYRPYYRPYIYGGLYARPYYYGYYGGGYYGGAYYGGGGYGYPIYSYPGYPYAAYFAPCAGELTALPQVTALGSSANLQPSPYQSPGVRPMQPSDEGDGTFLYDGGPRTITPMPGADPAPTKQPQKQSVPREGRFVSFPASPGSGVTYPAYGETLKQQPAPPPSQASGAPTRLVSYPAYGEQPSAPSVKTVVTRAN
ncbi:MAG: hypothetical protein HY040_13765 [Planctomycetes bacterium]|nr:hypothetical protein [Planctomycetota bacterium]